LEVNVTPLSETTFYILLSLVPRPQHGYAIMQEVAALSENRVHLSTGTLYTALKRLLDDGWIEQIDELDAPRGRKAYQLTPSGRAAVHQETTRITALSALAHRQLGDAQ
jgi:DNA-binding PadR family transcriptional regulator